MVLFCIIGINTDKFISHYLPFFLLLMTKSLWLTRFLPDQTTVLEAFLWIPSSTLWFFSPWLLHVLIKLYNLSLICSKFLSSVVFHFHAQCNDYLLKRVTGISPLELWWNWYSFVIHFPVKGSTHGISCLGLIPKVIVVNDINHGTYNSFMVQCNLIWNMKTESTKTARQSSHLSPYRPKNPKPLGFFLLPLLYYFLNQKIA